MTNNKTKKKIIHVLCHSIERQGFAISSYKFNFGFEQRYVLLTQNLGYNSLLYYMSAVSRRTIHQKAKCRVKQVCFPAVCKLGFNRDFSFKLINSIRKEEPDIVHMHGDGLILDLLGLKVSGIPIILHIHGPGRFMKSKLSRVPAGLKILRYPEQKLHSHILKTRVSMVITQSEIERSFYMDRFGIPSNRITKLYPGFDPNIFYKRNKRICREILKIPESKIVFVFTGHRIKMKGLDVLLLALRDLKKERRLRSFCLYIAGLPPENRWIKEVCEKYNLKEEICCLAWVPQEKLALYINAADIFISPSREEPFGKMNIEAMACGVPVISTAVGGILETVIHGDNGILVPPGDYVALANAIENLVRNESIRLEYGRNGLARAHQYFTWDNTAKKLKELYNDLVSN